MSVNWSWCGALCLVACTFDSSVAQPDVPAAAADTFADRLEDGSLSASDVTCTPASSFNLAAAAAAYAGLAIDSTELRDQVQVYRTRPALL